MLFAGLDIHKRVVEAVVLDASGTLLHRQRFDCTREELVRFAKKHLGPNARVALEATTNTWSIVDVLRPHAGEVVVSNPLRTRAIAEAKIKTDKVDSLVLAQLLRADFLPRVWQPDAPTQARRRTTTRRASLVSDRTRVKNRIHAVLHQRLIAAPVDDLFSKRGLTWLRGVELDAPGRCYIDGELRLLETIDGEIEGVDASLVLDAHADPRAKLLMTLPGVDYTIAITLLATLGDIARFKDGDHAASYLGIVPSTRQSAEHCYHGPITKQGRAHARWMLVQAAQHLSKHPGPLGVFFRRIAKKKNRNVAVVAAARKLVVVAFHMLKNNEPYRYAIPSTVDAKLARLRVKATGQKRKAASTRGAPRSPNYGSGQRTRPVHALGVILEREGLPPLHPPRPAETRALAEQGLTEFVDSLHVPRRVPKPRRPKNST